MTQIIGEQPEIFKWMEQHERLLSYRRSLMLTVWLTAVISFLCLSFAALCFAVGFSGEIFGLLIAGFCLALYATTTRLELRPQFDATWWRFTAAGRKISFVGAIIGFIHIYFTY